MALEKIRIEKIYSEEKKGRNGSFETWNIMTTLNGKAETWINGYKNKNNAGWSEGDVVLIDTYENKNGYLCYNVPDDATINQEYLKALLKKTARIEEMLRIISGQQNPSRQATKAQSANAQSQQHSRNQGSQNRNTKPNPPQNNPNTGGGGGSNVDMSDFENPDDDLPF